MKRILTLIALVAVWGLNANAQRVCGSMEHHHEMMDNDPDYAIRMEQIEQHTNAFVSHAAETGERVSVVIPVVFHVVYNTAAQNISDAQIQAQIAQLNLDYSRNNSDWTSTPTAFQSLAANTDIQFCLATVSPTGAATTGIERKSTTVTSFSTNDNIKRAVNGGLDAWPSSSYLNLWVGNLSGGVLGYAQFPGGAAATDGVVLQYSSVGSVATPYVGGAPYNLGRTATHEVGHWLNLRHIWGDANCGNDLVADTPTSQTSNFGCPTFPHVTCSNGANGDMFMNYMDYTDDACMYMFTLGQKDRMQSLFATGGARVSLLSSTGCGTPSGCGAPSSLAATAITQTSATLGWAAVAGATSYTVQYKLSTSTTWTSATVATNSYALSGLTAGTTYNFQVQSTCTSGTSAFSTSSTFTTTSVVAACGTPAPTAGTITSSGAVISWSAISGATTYSLQYKLGTATTWTTVSTASTSYTLTGLTASTAYNFQVSATCTGSTSAYSTAGTFTTSAATTGGCTDTWESNNTSTTAKTITTNTDITAMIGSTTDKDWFKFTITSAARNIKIDLTNLPGDYDFKLYRGTSTLLTTQQASGTTSETYTLNNATVATYYIQVYGYSSAFSATQCYNLRVNASSAAFREGAGSEVVELTSNVVVEKLEAVTAYPNPTSDELNVMFNAPKEGLVYITMLDITGREVSATSYTAAEGQNKVQFSMAELANGYYTIVLNDGTTRSALRVAKK